MTNLFVVQESRFDEEENQWEEWEICDSFNEKAVYLTIEEARERLESEQATSCDPTKFRIAHFGLERYY